MPYGATEAEHAEFISRQPFMKTAQLDAVAEALRRALRSRNVVRLGRKPGARRVRRSA